MTGNVYVCLLKYSNISHFFSFFVVINAGKKRYRTANLSKIRRNYEQDTLRKQIIPDETNRFRHFYHIRRANGDALSTVNFLK